MLLCRWPYLRGLALTCTTRSNTQLASAPYLLAPYLLPCCVQVSKLVCEIDMKTKEQKKAKYIKQVRPYPHVTTQCRTSIGATFVDWP